MIIYHHLGLGDCFMCAGMIRYFASIRDKVTTFCKPAYIDTIRYLYRDVNNIQVLEMDDPDVINFLRYMNGREEILCVGYLGRDWNTLYENQPKQIIMLDWMFYYQAGISLDYKWDSFYLQRDSEREMAVFNRFKEKYGIEEGKYVFFHDTSKQAYNGFNRSGIGGEIDFGYIEDKTLPVIRPEDVKFNMLDYAYLLENAAELHMINSSFFNLAELIPTKGKLFYHVYPRPYDCITLRKPWIKLMNSYSDN
jgi:hypothetical protein